MIRKTFVLLALLLVSCLAVAVDYPMPRGYVNDFANIIPDDREAVLEQKLRSYEKETSVEISVVTTPSLDGMSVEEWTIGLARKWGVGKKEKDNGLVLAVAPKERDYRVEVGFGLEGAVTDGIAGQLAREALPTAFRAGDYAGGIDKLLSSLIDTIGHLSQEERIKALAEKNEKERVEAERAAAFVATVFQGLGAIIAFLVGLLGLRYLVRAVLAGIREWHRKNLLRKKVFSSVAALDEKLASVGRQVAGMRLVSIPQWIAGAVDQDKKSIIRISSEAENVKKIVLRRVTDDPDQAMVRVAQYQKLLDTAQGHLDSLSAVNKKITQFREQTEQAVVGACASVKETENVASQMIELGFRLEGDVGSSGIDILKSSIGELEIALSNRGSGKEDTSDHVLEMAQNLAVKAGQAKAMLEALSSAKAYVEAYAPEITKRLSVLTGAIVKGGEALGRVRTSSPQRVWDDVGKRFGGVEGMVRQIRSLLESIAEKNSMEVQAFSEAKRDAQSAEELLSDVGSTLSDVSELEDQITAAKTGYPSLLHETEAAISAAETRCHNGDVGMAAKQKLAEARQKLGEAERAEEGSPADWLLAVALLAAAGQLAEEAERRARSDIDDAEEGRQQSERAAAAALAPARSESDYSISSPSNFFILNSTPFSFQYFPNQTFSVSARGHR